MTTLGNVEPIVEAEIWTNLDSNDSYRLNGKVTNRTDDDDDTEAGIAPIG